MAALVTDIRMIIVRSLVYVLWGEIHDMPAHFQHAEPAARNIIGAGAMIMRKEPAWVCLPFPGTDRGHARTTRRAAAIGTTEQAPRRTSMLRRCVLTLSLAMALGAAVQWKASAAPTYICVGLCTGIIVTDPDKPIPEPGKLVNILDVPVNGSLYDVAFVDGRFSEIFGTSSPSLLFTSQTGAELAAQALSNVLVDIGSGGPTSVQAFDSSPKLTRGCSLSLSGGCAIMTPFEVPSFLGGAAFRQVSFANANPFLGVGSADEFLGIPAGLLELAGFDFASDNTRTFAVWRVAGGTAPDDPQVRFFTPPAFGEPSTSRVPEPGVLFLMAVGLAGLAASRKTRSRNSRWIPG